MNSKNKNHERGTAHKTGRQPAHQATNQATQRATRQPNHQSNRRATRHIDSQPSRKARIAIAAIIIIAIAAIVILYSSNPNIRNWIDVHIFRKEVLQEQATYIELENDNAQICAYSGYIGALSNNQFDIYNSSATKEETLTVEISNPIFDSNNRFLAIAEKDGQSAYLIQNKAIQWQVKVEGNISQIHVNKNGYVAVVITNTTYKNVVEMYSPQGEAISKTFLSSTRVADASVSQDNKHLAIAEVDTSGTIIQSTIKIISLDKLQEDASDANEKTYTSEANRLITNVNYQDGGVLLCQYTDGITAIRNDQEEQVGDNTNKKIIFSSIDLSNYSVTVEERSSGIFTADSVVCVTNSQNRLANEHTVNLVTKDLFVDEKTIAINLGTEVEFLNTGGNLIKRYIANQEISNIVLSDEVAGIIYRNKIEIVKL